MRKCFTVICTALILQYVVRSNAITHDADTMVCFDDILAVWTIFHSVKGDELIKHMPGDLHALEHVSDRYAEKAAEHYTVHMARAHRNDKPRRYMQPHAQFMRVHKHTHTHTHNVL